MAVEGMNMTYLKKRNDAGERLYRMTIDGIEYKCVTLDEAAKIIADRDLKMTVKNVVERDVKANG